MRRALWPPNRGRVVLAQLRRDRARSVTTAGALAVATAAFTVLTGAADTSKIVANRRVASVGPSAYDILVRPRGAETPVERASGQVNPNFLDGVFGGISVAQYDKIEKIPGVSVAAPVAMAGYALQTVVLPLFDVPRELGGRLRQLYALSIADTTDRGLSHVPAPPSYVYVTGRPLVSPPDSGTMQQLSQPVREREEDGALVPVCSNTQQQFPDPYVATARDSDACLSLVSGPRSTFHLSLRITIPLLIEAIDPAQEARLDGLDHAVVAGRYLRVSDRVDSVKGGITSLTSPRFPVIVSSRNYLDDTVTATLQRLSGTATDAVRTRPLGTTEDGDRGAGPAVETRRVSMDAAYQRLVQQLRGQVNRNFFSPIDGLWRVDPIRYAGADRNGTLRPQAVTNPSSAWASQFQAVGFVEAPPDTQDRAFRALHEHVASSDNPESLPAPIAVGEFDPDRLAPFDPLTHVPLGGYEAPQASPAGTTSRTLLQGRDLLPNSNLAGYLTQPPQLITTLAALPALENGNAFTGNLDPAHPISAIRVRVAGARSQNALSRARIDLAAQDILNATGLQVDITAGSSPSTRVTDLPAGRYGRPALAIREGWVSKGVALKILRAVDSKSLLLFVLVLFVCGLFVLNATAAAVRARRRQLALLACVGWPARKLFANAVTEQAVLGTIAGVVGVAAAVPIARGTALHVTWSRSAIAVLAAIGLAMLASLGPAAAASRIRPLEALEPPVGRFRSHRPVRNRAGLVVRNVIRGRLRSVIAVAGLGVGVCSTVLLLAVTTSFNGQLAGDLLGDAVIIRVRGVDYAAVAVMLALGVFGIADVLYLNVRERAGELATLQATGWSAGQIGTLVTGEGLLLGALGSLAGSAAGIALIGRFTSEPFADAASLAAIALVAGTVLGALAAVLPARAVPRSLASALTRD